jgi:glutamyl-tRNA reductase
MTFYAFGVNHLRAPVEVREAFALHEEGKRELHRAIRLSPESELILLSTCNRTEAYLYGAPDDVEVIKGALCLAAGRPWPHDRAFMLQDEDAVHHILEVAAGIKSLVLGDAQIFSQLKEAYRVAVEEERVGTTMHRLMHTAFRVAKRVINETDLGSGAASVPYVAVDAAMRSLASRHEPNVRMESLTGMVVGCGSMARMAIEALRASGVSSITVTNRSEDRGREVAARSGTDFVKWDSRHTSSTLHDIVIVATSAESPVMLAAELRQLERSRTTFVDISVPRNVEAGICDLGYMVISLDDLVSHPCETESIRRDEIPDARRIVHEMLGEFVSWVFHHQALQPVIQTIADTFETIRAGEVDRHHQRFSDIDRLELDRLTQSIIQKILAVPVVRLKSVEPESISFVQGIRLLHALFRRGACEDGSTSDIVPLNPAGRAESPMAVREDCPIDPQLTNQRIADRISDLELDDVLRLFSGRELNADQTTASGDEHRKS